jgi:hypothetical protein
MSIAELSVVSGTAGGSVGTARLLAGRCADGFSERWLD